jgi:hypothetical protein
MGGLVSLAIIQQVSRNGLTAERGLNDRKPIAEQERDAEGCEKRRAERDRSSEEPMRQAFAH